MEEMQKMNIRTLASSSIPHPWLISVVISAPESS
jgi:hypothetical protein